MDISYNLLPNQQGIPTVEGVNLRACDMDSEETQKTLRKLEKTLGVVNYHGFVFLGCHTDYEKGERKTVVVDLQVSPPDGFWAAFARGLEMPMGLFFDRACNPKRRSNTPYEFYKPGYIVSRKLTLPPYPYTEASWVTPKSRLQMAREGIPATRFFRQKWGVYWNDVFQAEGDKGFLQACGPLLGYVVGRGETYVEAVGNCQDQVSSIQIPYAQIKVDDSLAEFNLAC
jgi:hypothetical protein